MGFKKATEFIKSCPVLDDPVLGLGEAGEVMELIKKDRRPGKYRQPLDTHKLSMEVYDVFFYLTRILEDNGLHWKDAITAGEEKLTKRYEGERNELD